MILKTKIFEVMGGVNIAELVKGKNTKVTLTFEELSLISASLCVYKRLWDEHKIKCPKTELLLHKITNEIIKIRTNVTSKS